MKFANRVTTATLLLLGISAIALSGCQVDKTQEGELPKVSTEGGQLPAYDVEAADVSVGTREETITVPDVDVTMPDEKRDPEER
ncbi:MAG: hypothetical protein H0W24_08690 [Lysobacter sp.]|jgi:hypothetical protein|nr:hypothetical protein [Lysobacter sp.]MDQ3270070.1 hypothetical protein [Pseudomonadota bacterium]